ncbi:hypothetical protein TNCV_1208591 [Trichonephila clavipes]|nr:hypothetical protein TNCV_1208591 [Trichonephila clavipes]
MKGPDFLQEFLKNAVSEDELQEAENDNKEHELEIMKLEADKNRLEENKIDLTDIGDSCEIIDILIGADVMATMLAGRRKVLSSGLVAVETYLGWNLKSKVPQEGPLEENLAMTVLPLFVKLKSLILGNWI